ncbi:MAG: bifunctional alpha/beta hydrolase/class I SAM-dependent methyltransferase [Planctomycetota bacterium]
MPCTELTFKSVDGVPLFYRAWNASRPGTRAAILFHRGHEHSGRMEETAAALAAAGMAVFAWDQRGHGKSPGDRGWAEDLGVFVKDAEAFARHLEREHGVRMQETLILGYSVGAVLAASWIHDYAPPVRGLVLAAPAFRVKLYVPFALTALRLRRRMGGKFFVKSYVKSRWVTHDPDQQDLYDADPLIFRQIAGNILLDLRDASERLIRDAGAIVAPTLVLSAAQDYVVSVADQKRFFDGLSSPLKEWHLLSGFHHAVLHERERAMAIGMIVDFAKRCFDRPAGDGASLLQAHRAGFTQREHDELSTPLSIFSPKRWMFAAARAWMRTVGRLSDGIALGWRRGFDSGVSLDHVYRDRASGSLGLGRLIDRVYLNSIGWRGIRRRKQNMESLLASAIAETRAAGRPVRILDVACGGGRYVLDALRRDGANGTTAVLRDWSDASVRRATDLARELGVPGVTVEKSDAFDRASLESVSPAPTIAIVSGLYELFGDNDRVLESLKGIAAAMKDGGVLLYTNQPWHPQLEMIARVLVNRDGAPWIMRRRTQAEMDQLAAAAGFVKRSMEVDPWGIFTVSLAAKA